MDAPELLPADERVALDVLAADLRRIFGVRLRSVVAYGLDGRRRNRSLLHTMAMVDRVTFDDLAACVPSASRWRGMGLDVPLIISRDEFLRTLDVFPLEYSDIISNHIVVHGEQPFGGVGVSGSDLRRACEQQARSHLIHLREGFLESGGDPRDISRLIADSAPSFRMLLANLESLQQPVGVRNDASDDDLAEEAERTLDVPASLVREVLASPSSATTIADPTALLSRYITAAEAIWAYVDRWRHA
jgi:hypothetical protein